jgi:hypothetical protein
MDRLGVDNRFQLGLTLGTMRAARPPGLTLADHTDQDPTS